MAPPPPNQAAPSTTPAGDEVSSLDHRNLSVDPSATAHADQSHRFWRFAPWVRVLKALLPLSGIDPRRIEKWKECGTNAWVQRSPSTRKYRLVCNTCKQRWCPACRRSTNMHVRDYVRDLLTADHRDEWRFVTLTLRSTNAPLTTQLANLRKSFRKLRQRRFWRDRVKGGITITEITWNPTRKQWHPHYHVLVRGSFIPQRDLSSHWLSITKTSMIVDIRRVRRVDNAVDYVTKYLTKLPDPAMLNDQARFNDWIAAMTSFKTLNRFGDVRGYKPAEHSADYPTDWEPFLTLACVREKARRGDLQCRTILSVLENSRDPQPHPDLFDKPPDPVSVLLHSP